MRTTVSDGNPAEVAAAIAANVQQVTKGDPKLVQMALVLLTAK